MRHYVLEHVTKGVHSKVIGNYSATNIKDVVLHIMQQEFIKNFERIRYTITKTESNMLNNYNFYKTGITYKQIKELSNDDIEDICLMITNSSDRLSLDYLRISVYLTKTPIIINTITKHENTYNKACKPIKVKCIPKHLLNFYGTIKSTIPSSRYYINIHLAKAFGLDQKINQGNYTAYNHIKQTLINAGIDLSNINYSLIPKPISDVMLVHSHYFKQDVPTNHHKRFDGFFRDYFKYYTYSEIYGAAKVYISPFLASALNLSYTTKYTAEHIKNKIQTYFNANADKAKELIYIDKKDYLNKKYFNIDEIYTCHTIPEYLDTQNCEELFVNYKIKYGNNYKKYNSINIDKSVRILQKFYKNTRHSTVSSPKSTSSSHSTSTSQSSS